MWLEMRQIFETLSHDARVRCIMLSGAGEQAFCSGLDVQVYSDCSIAVLILPYTVNNLYIQVIRSRADGLK